MGRKIYVYIDESGDLGFRGASSKYFIMAAVATEKPKEIGRKFKKVRSRLLKKRYRNIPEFKFSESDEFIREKVLETINSLDVEIWFLIVEKEKVYPKLKNDTSLLYNYFAGSLMSPLKRYSGKEIHIRIDRSLNRTKRDRFNDYLHKRKNWLETRIGEINLKSIEHVDSKKEAGIQVADFVAGAAFQKFERGNGEYIEKIQEKIIKIDHKWGVKIYLK